MARLKTYILSLIALLLVAASCSKEPGDVPAADRTLIVYLGGDNNLSGESFQKLDALQLVVSQNPIFAQGSPSTILVYHDPATASGALPSLWRLQHGQTLPQLVETYPTENSASAHVLQRVIGTCTRIAPASSYGLWLFSHASGWLPPGALTNPQTNPGTKSVVVDGKNEMEIADLAAAIPDGMFDFIVFETCFMAGVEVAYELRNKTDYILASAAEILSPGFTDLYSRVIPPLFDPKTQHNTLGALTTVAQTLFKYRDAQEGVEKSATVSIIDTKHLNALAVVIRDIASQLPEPLDIMQIQHFDRYRTHRLFFDLNDFLQCFAPNSAQLAAAIAAAVPHRQATPQFMNTEGYNGFEIREHCGLTTYIEQQQFALLNTAYKKTAWYNATH